jgi:signal transduction histidine kinase
MSSAPPEGDAPGAPDDPRPAPVHDRALLAALLERFAVGVGHDLRNPLSVIESSAFLLRRLIGAEAGAGSKIDQHLSRISAEVKRAESMLTDLTTLARGRPLRRGPTPVAALLASAVSAANPPTSVEVILGVSPDLVAAVDADLLERALRALLANAVHAMDGSGRVRLDAERVGLELHISVGDTGPGVPAPLRALVFEPLFTTKAKASGLGLALARRAAEAHGGTIVLQPSEVGALFVLRVPAER